MSRAFGIGGNHAYNIFLAGDSFPYTYLDLIMPDGGRIHYIRTSAGTGYSDAIYEHTGTQTEFYKSLITWNGNGWNLMLKDGTLWVFPEAYQKSATQGAIISMADRHGNTITLSRDLATGNLNRILSSSGRSIDLTYDTFGRITRAQDGSGRTVSYSYDSSGRLSQVTNAGGGITKYAYDPQNRLISITDPRNFTFVTNYYDASGRVIEQVQADGGVFRFSFTLDTNGNIVQTDVTNPRGYIERSVFDSTGYYSGGNLVAYIEGVGQTEQQSRAYQYQANGTGLTHSTTDALGRQTNLTYDSCGNVTSVTALAGTAGAVTTSRTYQTGTGSYPCVAVYNRVLTITDPLNHTTTFGYDGSGKNLTSVTDALSHSMTISPNSNGQPATITNSAGSTQFGYINGDLTSITDPTSNTGYRSFDNAGRLTRVLTPLGEGTQYQYDPLDLLTKIIDPLGMQTGFAYDGNGNLLTVQDALGHISTYSRDSMDRISTRTDPLSSYETRQYDLNGNPTVFVDRKNQVATNSYDSLDRLKQTQFADLSTITYTYDAGNRITQIVDSANGTITRTYDDLDRLASETTPQGTVSYSYDNAGRRTSMTVAGQSAVNYTYDNANRLTQITQGSATVTMAYDNSNRRTSLTLPNGIVAAYGYDAASRVTSITYTQGAATIGDLTYGYDANGRQTSMGGSLAAVNLPTAITSATYSANNQLTNWNGITLTYDANGNMTSDGTTTHAWNARNQLSAFGSTGLAYDGFGRRRQNASGKSFVYDGDNSVQELSGSTVTANLLGGLGVDEIFTRTDSAGERNMLTDALGSTIALADSSGTVQTQYAFEPFGKATASGQSNTNTFQYTGRENDGTGLYYYRARYYHPTLQRFISEDPIEFDGGDTNLYAYVQNSPTNFTDPSGNCPMCAAPLLATPLGWATGAAVAVATFPIWGPALGDALRDFGARFDPSNPPHTWPDPLNPPEDWTPREKPNTWKDPDGDTWKHHDQPGHGPEHWDIGPAKDSPYYPKQWWWPKGDRPGPKPPGKDRSRRTPPSVPGRKNR